MYLHFFRTICFAFLNIHALFYFSYSLGCNSPASLFSEEEPLLCDHREQNHSPVFAEEYVKKYALDFDRFSDSTLQESYSNNNEFSDGNNDQERNNQEIEDFLQEAATATEGSEDFLDYIRRKRSKKMRSETQKKLDQKSYRTAYYEKNKEKIREANASYYKKNQERLRQQKMEYTAKNREKIKAYHAARRAQRLMQVKELRMQREREKEREHA